MLRKTILAHALSIAFTATVASLAANNVAWAQAQTGSINGNAVAGSTVTIVNKDIGYSRTITVGADGKFQASQLPGGQYVLSSGGETQSVSVSAGEGSFASFSAGGTGSSPAVNTVA